jgi:hypothetical protein
MTKPSSRVYTIGMQSSGSSVFSYFVAQVPGSLAITDLWVRQPVPKLDVDMPVSLKTCICDVRCFLQDVRDFKPTVTILYVRHPGDIYQSLRSKWYYNDGGSFESKLEAFEELFVRRGELFDLTVHYEDFTVDPWRTGAKLRERGVQLPDAALEFPRSLDAIRDFAVAHDPWCRENFGIRWTHANIHRDKLATLRPISYGPAEPAALEKMRRLCPTVMEHYDTR